MPTPEEMCAARVTADVARADQAATAAGVVYDRVFAAKSRTEARTHLARLDNHAMRAYNLSLTALRTAARAGEVSVIGNVYTCSAAADAARACECASRAATYAAAAATEIVRRWGV